MVSMMNLSQTTVPLTSSVRNKRTREFQTFRAFFREGFCRPVFYVCVPACHDFSFFWNG